MAIKKITSIQLAQNTLSAALTFEAATTISSGFAIPYVDQDHKILILAKNAHATVAKTLTIKSGNSIQGVADTEAFSIGAGETRAINLESGKFKWVSGDNKGHVVAIPESTDIQIAVVVLP